MKKDISKKLFCTLLASALPVFYLLFWLLKNTQLPGNDAANYMMTAVDIYHHYSDHGLLNGIYHTFATRGWRPIFFPVMAVPFLLMSHGSLYFAFSSVALLCLVASTIYLYLFFRLKLDRISAIIATNLIGLLPLIQAQLVMFYGEGPLFPCVIGAIYHLIKSSYFRDIKHTCGFVILFTLAFLFRPVEALTHFVFVLSLFLFLGCHKKIFTGRQILKVIACGILAVFLFFLMCAKPYLHFITLNTVDNGLVDLKMAKAIRAGVVIAFACTVLIWGIVLIPYFKNKMLSLIRNHKTQSLLVPVFAISFAIILVWFLPYAADTFQWIFRTSFGDVASNTIAARPEHIIWTLMQTYTQAEGWLVVAGIVLVTVISLFLFSKHHRRDVISSLPFLYLILILPIPFWETFCTVQVSVRKLSIAYPALLMAMLLICLQQGRGWSVRFVAISVLAIAQFVLAIQLIFTNTYTHPSSWISNSIGYYVSQPVTLSPNPHDVVIDFLNQQSKAHHLNSIALEVNPGSSDAMHFKTSQPIDPFLLSTMILSQKQNYSTSYPYLSNYAVDNTHKLAERYDAIFISDSAANMKVSEAAAKAYMLLKEQETSPSLKTFYDFLIAYSQNKLSGTGWILGPCITIQSVGYGNYFGCILIKARGTSKK